MTSNSQQTWFEKFDRHPRVYVILTLTLYLLINNGINALSTWADHNRGEGPVTIQLWEPYVWEYTSAVSSLILFPLVITWFARFPIRVEHLAKQIGLHLAASIVYSALHVGIMVGLRKLLYLTQQRTYDFGPWLGEFIYEYRKDLMSYLFLMFLYYVYQFIYSRLKGEATLLDTERKSAVDSGPEHLLVKKLDKEFVVKVADIEWLEASGNYVNLHSEGRIYPLRSTLSALIPKLESRGFSRVHRSYGVNHNMISSIGNQPSGDAEITLKSGQILMLSRRYKDAFKQKLR